ncbi:MAG TPA: TauD/TfdA family dioxygenase [Pyrinomonadaceae bacterium]|jgi:alpha-ketoglutarate-dependent taurine dioxygenase
MEESDDRKRVGGGLKLGRRKAVGLSPESLVRTSLFSSGATLPLVVEPAAQDVRLEEWIASSREFVEANLLKHGAILFRGFEVGSAPDFERCAKAASGHLFGEYGDLPREGADGVIYQSTPYPPDKKILFHNEASHTHRWPMKQWFFCVQPAAEGGETPVVDCRKVYARLGDEIVERFRRKRVVYVRNFVDGLDVDWRQFFKTSDRAAVEQICRDASIECEWKSDGLRIRQVCPAVAVHPKTGEPVFFNQLQLHHVSCMSAPVRDALLSLFRMEDLPRNVYYGDGSPIEDALMEEIGRVYRELEVGFRWRAGDILMLDNMLTAHARNPYQGARKILVAMAEMVSAGDISN